MKTPSILKRCAILAAAAGAALFGALGAQAAEAFVNGTLQSFEPKTFVVKSETRPAPTTYTAAKNIQFVDEAGVAVAPGQIQPGMRVSVYYFQQEGAMVAHRLIVRGEVATTTTVPDRPRTKPEAEELRAAQELSEREARRAAEKGKRVSPPDASQPAVVATPTPQPVSPATGNPVDPTRTPASPIPARPAPQPVSPATGNPVDSTKPPASANPGRTSTPTEEETGIVGEVDSGEFTVEVDKARAPRKYSHNTATIYSDEAGRAVLAETIRPGVAVTVQYSNEGQRRIATKVTVRKDKPVRPEELEPKRDENRAKEDAERLLKKEKELRSKKLEK